MTSHEWQRGNRYGHSTEPTYNIVPYTCGRCMLKEPSMPDFKAVSIRGLTWDVPRIDPAYFSDRDFERLIQKCTTYRSNKVEGMRPDTLTTEHLWLDIACIDQEDEKIKRSGLGRQATIFEHAETALLWLSHHITEQLGQSLRQFVEAIEQFESGAAMGWTRTAAEALDLLLQDP